MVLLGGGGVGGGGCGSLGVVVGVGSFNCKEPSLTNH